MHAIAGIFALVARRASDANVANTCAALLLLLSPLLVGCHDAGGAADMAACLPHTSGDAPYPCGPLTCAPDEYCFFEAFGYCPPPDLASAADGATATCGQFSCAKLPASCDCSQLCGGPSGQAGPTGCLHAVPACQYANAGCFLRGSTIFCGEM